MLKLIPVPPQILSDEENQILSQRQDLINTENYTWFLWKHYMIKNAKGCFLVVPYSGEYGEDEEFLQINEALNYLYSLRRN